MKKITLSIIIIIIIISLFAGCKAATDPGTSEPTLEEMLQQVSGVWYKRPDSWTMGQFMFKVDAVITDNTATIYSEYAKYQYDYDWQYEDMLEFKADSFTNNSDGGTIDFMADYYEFIYDAAGGSLTLRSFDDLEHNILLDSVTLHRTLANPEYEFAYDIYKVLPGAWYVNNGEDNDDIYQDTVSTATGNVFEVSYINGNNEDTSGDGNYDHTEWGTDLYFYNIYELSSDPANPSIYFINWGSGEETYSKLIINSFSHYQVDWYTDDSYTTLSHTEYSYLSWAEAEAFNPPMEPDVTALSKTLSISGTSADRIIRSSR